MHLKQAVVIPIALLVALCTPLCAQSPFGDFLTAAKDDPSVTSLDMQVRYLENKPYRLSPLQKLEVRTRSNQLDPSRQDYALRVNPANPWELHQNSQYFKALASVLALKKNMAFKEALVKRYTLVIDLVTSLHEKELAERELKFIQTYLGMLEQQQMSSFFDADDFVELKLDEVSKSVAVDEESFEAVDKAHQIEALYPSAATGINRWTLDQVIGIDGIEHVVDSLENISAGASTVAYYEHRISLANRAYALEKANINVGYIQAQYQHYRLEQDRQPWNIGIGVTIPIVNPNKGDMTKKRLDVMESEQELESVKTDLKADQIRLREQLRNYIQRHKTIEQKIETLRSSTLATTLKAMQNENPVATVKFEGNLLKLESLATKLKQQILLTYLDWLVSMDALQQTPLVNYLSKNREILQR